MAFLFHRCSSNFIPSLCLAVCCGVLQTCPADLCPCSEQALLSQGSEQGGAWDLTGVFTVFNNMDLVAEGLGKMLASNCSFL